MRGEGEEEGNGKEGRENEQKKKEGRRRKKGRKEKRKMEGGREGGKEGKMTVVRHAFVKKKLRSENRCCV